MNSQLSPSTTDTNGRDDRGRFTNGNRLANGNPHARRVARLRAAILRVVQPDDIKQVIAALIREAQSGNVQAIKELLDRTIGKPLEADLIERIELLERFIQDNRHES